jgi:hypothetical protein
MNPTQPPTVDNSGFPDPGPPNSDYQTRFNAAYYASKPARFQPFYYNRPGGQIGTERTYDQRMILADSLYKEGIIFDQEIDAEGGDPYTIMFMRQVRYNYKWVYPGTGTLPVTSVVSQAELQGNPPVGVPYIPVSCDIANYPRA